MSLDETEDRREYHRLKAKEQRENWKTLGCAQVAHHVPTNLKTLVRGQTTCLTAVHCLSLIREQDDAALDVMANTRPKYDVKLEDVDILKGRGPALDARCEYMEKLLREARWHRAEGEAKRSLHSGPAYHYAMEWCIVSYVKGYYDITLHMVKSGKAHLDYEFEVFDMRDFTPDVLHANA